MPHDEPNGAADVESDVSLPPPGVSGERSTLIAWAVVGGAGLVALVLGIIIWRVATRPKEDAGDEKPPTAVVVRPLEPETVVDRIRLPGIVSAWREVTVSAQVGGVVVSVEVDEGDEVAKGEVLCRVDDRDHKAALDKENAALDQARAARDLAELRFERVRRLKADKVIGQSEYDSSEAALRQAKAMVERAAASKVQAALTLERTVVVAPMRGTVSEVSAEAGALISPGGSVARIVDIRKVRVAVGIPERDVRAVEKLTVVDLTLSAVPGKVFAGKRTYLGVEPRKGSRTYRLELEVDNPEREIRPGMFATADIIRGTLKGAIVIPLFAVIPREKDRIVFVEEDGVARRRVVRIGLMMGSRIEKARVVITRGLSSGDRLIVVGHRQVEDGQKVRPGPAPEALKKVIQ